MFKIDPILKAQIKNALLEDIGKGDITSRTLIPSKASGRARVVAKEAGVFCGESLVREVFRQVNPKVRVELRVKDGASFTKGKTLLEVKGPVISLLEGERTALNFLGHLCGIAQKAKAFIDAVKPYKPKILDTRKTTPLWRSIEKYAVRCGGGHNHRMGLYDAFFIKENHRKFGNLDRLRFLPGKFEIEVRNVREMMEALMLSPKVILFDNFEPAVLKEAVMMARKCSPRVILEASGGITLENVKAYARTGVDQISIGSLTHSVKAVDLSFLVL